MLSILEPIWPFYSILRVLGVVINIALLFVFLFALSELARFRPPFLANPQRAPKKRNKRAPRRAPTVTEAWTKVKERLASGTAEGARLAVIEGDALVDNYLKHSGYAGETFADRLARIDSNTITAAEGAWAAHRLRNDLVHTPGFTVSADQAAKALEDHETFLRQMGAFDSGPAAEHGGKHGAAHVEVAADRHKKEESEEVLEFSNIDE